MKQLVRKSFMVMALIACLTGLSHAAIYVAATGDDDTGDGSTGAPYRTITMALSVLGDETEIQVGAGLYDTVTAGEVFPLNVPAGVSIIGVLGPNEDDTDSTLVDADGGTAFVLSPTPDGTTGVLQGLVVTNFLLAADMTEWQGTIDNCLFTDCATGSSDALLFFHAPDRGKLVLTLTNTVVDNLTNTSASHLWRFWPASGTVVTIDDCTFSNLTLGQPTDRRGLFNFEYPGNQAVVVTGSVFENITYTAQDHVEAGMFECFQGTFVFDRCTVRDIALNTPIISLNRVAAPLVRDSLFYNVDAGNHSAVGAFYCPVDVRNCTFDSCSTVLRTNWGTSLSNIYNTIISNCTSLNTENPDSLRLHSVALYNTGGLNFYDSDYSENVVIDIDPLYRDRDSGDYRLKNNSPFVDAGNDDYVNWADPVDIDEETRIMDGNYDGTAAVDIGCDEFNPVPSVPTFTMPPYYHVFEGESATIPVGITPGAAASVTADVTLETGLTGPATLTIADGAGPRDLAVTVSAGAGSYQGTALNVEITHSAGPAVEPGQCNVVAYSKEVTITGSAKLIVVSGSTVELPVTFVSDVLQYPRDVTVTTGAPAGAGTNTIAWVDGNTIAAGDSTTAGHLSVTGDSGVNTVQLSVDEGFAFNESGAASFTLEVIALSSPIHVAADGDDATGYGTAGAPFRTITKALTLTHLFQEIAVGPGTYDAAAGEIFPLDVPAGVEIVGTMGPNQDATDSTVIDAGGAAEVLRLRNTPDDGETFGLLKDVVVTNALGSIGEVTAWIGTIDGCVLKEVADAGAVATLLYSKVDTCKLTMTNCTVKDITSTNQYLMKFIGAGSVVIDGCTFQNIASGVAEGKRAVMSFEGLSLTVTDSVFDTISWGYSGTWGIEEGGLLTSWNQPMLVDRCVFRNITGGHAVVDPNRNGGVVRDSLFANVNVGEWGAVRAFYCDVTVYNCTFDSCSSAVRADGWLQNENLDVHNSIVSNSLLNSADYARLRLHNVDLFNNDPDLRYDPENSDNVTTVDPLYIDAAAGDYHLKTYSPMVDAGNNAHVIWADPTDLDETARIQDGDGDAEGQAGEPPEDVYATVDLGAYESNYYDQLAPKFRAEFPVYHLFAGASVDINLYVDPAAAGAVDADVAYGTDLSGGASVSFPGGAGPVVLNVAAAAVLSNPSGSMSIITLTEAGTTSQGVAAGDVGVYLYENRVTIGVPTRLFVASAQEVLIKVSLVSDMVGAPGTLPIAVGTVGGAGTNTIVWSGGQTIPQGATESEGALSVTGGAGTNTVDLTIGGGFVFEETGTDTVTLTVVGYSSPIYVATDGDDDTGDGTLGNPLRTITYAASLLESGDEVRVLPGTYNPGGGEVFPIEPGAVRVVGYNTEGEADPFFHVIDGDSADVHLLKFRDASAGYLANFTLTNSGDSAVLADAAAVAIDNCIFQAISTPIDAQYQVAWGAALTLKNDANVTANDCVFTGLTGTAAVVISKGDANKGNNFVANGCEFSDNISDWGTLASTDVVDGRWFLTDCVFENNTVPESRYTKDSFCGSAVYTWGGDWDATSTLQADRCKFIGGQGGSVFGIGYTAEASVRNSLFLDNNNYAAIFHGYRWGLDVVNCTLVNNTGHMTGREPHFGVDVVNSIIDSQGALSGDGQQDRLTLTNTIVWNTPAGDGYNEAASANVLEVDPQFKNPDADDYHLEKLSPAIDAGDNSFVLGEEPLDLDGNRRIVDGDGNTELQVPPEAGDPVETLESVDLGCYEKQKPYLPGDANDDCKVNILDLIFIRNRLNQDVTTGDNWKADVNTDEKINILDLIFTRNHLNTTCPE